MKKTLIITVGPEGSGKTKIIKEYENYLFHEELEAFNNRDIIIGKTYKEQQTTEKNMDELTVGKHNSPWRDICREIYKSIPKEIDSVIKKDFAQNAQAVITDAFPTVTKDIIKGVAYKVAFLNSKFANYEEELREYIDNEIYDIFKTDAYKDFDIKIYILYPNGNTMFATEYIEEVVYMKNYLKGFIDVYYEITTYDQMLSRLTNGFSDYTKELKLKTLAELNEIIESKGTSDKYIDAAKRELKKLLGSDDYNRLK